MTPILPSATSLFKQESEPKPFDAEHPEAEDASEEAVDDGDPLLCRQCRHPITTVRERIEIQGGHQHAFANPHGIVYEIGCFRTAPGCAAMGAPTDDFTWFNGYRWRVALCGVCLTHLGWVFANESVRRFFGLILDRLVQSRQN